MSNSPRQNDSPSQQSIIIGRNIINSGVEIPADVADKDFWKLVVRYQFWYSMSGLIASLLCVIAGIALILNGILGTGKWSANILGLVISDAPPGIALFLIGLVLSNITSFSVKTIK